MFKLSVKLILSSQRRTLLAFVGNCTHQNIVNNNSRLIVTMNDPWPVLEKRTAEEDANDSSSKRQKVKRKMYAIGLAYCGQGYSGLQRNHGLKTIEEDLLVALKKIDVINDEEFRKQQLVNFQRAARTDKGVSAIRQVVNLSMRDGVTPKDLNEHLPEQIRILTIKRVTKGFNSKNTCDSRTYSYTCPTFAFAPKDIPVSEDFRMNDEIFENLNKYSQLFLGTHNFFSFTSGRKPFDPSCKRHIIEANWSKPEVSEGIELIILKIRGQSFMLHQIRKMVGTLMAVCRGYAGPDYISKALNPGETVYLPTAPGLGLLLEQVHYDWYNKKYGDNGFHEKLDFADVAEEVEEFRRKNIFPMLIRAEKEEKSMMNYLQTLETHYEEDHSIKPEEYFLDDETPKVVNDTKSETKSETDELAIKTEEKCNTNNESSTVFSHKESKVDDHSIESKVESINNGSQKVESETPSESSSPQEENLTSVSS